MALHSLRETLGGRGLRAEHAKLYFRTQADAALDQFRTFRENLRREVRRGELTPKVARERAADAANQLTEGLHKHCQEARSTPSIFGERLAEVYNKRQLAKATPTLETLQRETNRLLQANLVEQQIHNRNREFQSKTFERPVTGGEPAPTLRGLLQFHENAKVSGDESAREWSRRQLEGMKDQIVNPEDRKRLEQLCDLPGSLRADRVSEVLSELDHQDPSLLNQLSDEVIDSADPNACVALYLRAREAAGVDVDNEPWVTHLLGRLDAFPDSALDCLKTWEQDARTEENQMLHQEAERTGLIAKREAALPGLQTPQPHELVSIDRIDRLPAVAPGEQIGLSLQRRGFTPDEYRARTEPEQLQDAGSEQEVVNVSEV